MKILDQLLALQQEKQKMFAVIAATAVLAAVDVAFVVNLQMKSAGALGQKVAKTARDISTLQKELSLMQKNSQVLDQKQQNMRLYSEQDVPLILQLITVAAKENNVQIMQINPFKEKAAAVKEKKTKKDKDAPKQKVPEQQFIALGFELSINAAYHDVGAFLHQLQNSGQPIFAESYTMAAQADPLKQKLELTLKTHVKK